jgi:dTDP-4-dehydrorhamnose reductase
VVVDRRIEAWGGVECTVNRVADSYFDQLEWSGHKRRLDDIDRFAELGISALRFPILWEHCAGGDWSWTDAALDRLQRYQIRPIAGLLHHGSGPRSTHLLDPAFPERFCDYAATVAARYPWIRDFTPINEPMTTARFSALYGVWYPHRRSHADFVRALIHELRATVLGMQAIRRVQPDARLIQTEDFGRTYSTEVLAPLASDLNERRWLTPDLLCGRLKREGPMWRYLLRYGIAEEELHWFADNPCPPDILGINHYLTSDRFLDDEIELYPNEPHAAAGPFRFVDLDAVRRCGQCDLSAGGVLRDAWNRYGIPVAITEAHLGCTREEQMRWLAEIMSDARDLVQTGADVRAVTAWSLLGAFNWNVLVTHDAGHYESGVFDVRGSLPKPTALAAMVRAFAEGKVFDHPLLDSPGWWRRPERLLHSASHGRSYCYDSQDTESRPNRQARKLWIVNGETKSGKAIARACQHRGIDHQFAASEEDPGENCWAVIVCGESERSVGRALSRNLPLVILFDEHSGAIDSALNQLIDSVHGTSPFLSRVPLLVF